MKHVPMRRCGTRSGRRSSPATPRILALALALSGLAASAVGALDRPDRSAFDKIAPEGAADLRIIEAAARTVAEIAAQCTVGLELGSTQGCGVIVSSDGYVLTAAHVIARPGRDVRVKLPDGTVVAGKTLGIHNWVDAGLVKIDGDGPWTHASIVPRGSDPKVGDWCLASGHPNGFESERSPPIRLGRIIEARKHRLQTDCTITGGDSGGPLFDLDGRVIGIHSRLTEDMAGNFHGPALACAEAWDHLKAGQVYPALPPSHFLDRLDVNRDGRLSRAELPDGFYRRVFDRLADAFDLDADDQHSVRDLAESLGWRVSVEPEFGRRDRSDPRREESLGRRFHLRGRSVLRAFRDIVAKASESTVGIECDGELVALGCIVEADGWIVTKASRMTGEIRCTIQDGRTLSAHLMGTDAEHDLAMLRVDTTGLKPIEWSTPSVPTLGSWLASPNAKGDVAGVGVVSVGERAVVGTPGVLGVQLGSSEREAGIARVFPNSGAADAGLLDDDVITHILDQAVDSLGQIRAALKDYRPGDVVEVTVRRGDRSLSFEVLLGAREDVFFPRGGRRYSGPLSRRRDSFPNVIQHDMVLEPKTCGGPVVDIAGRVVGINIARADRIASYLVPSHEIERFVKRFKSDPIVDRESGGSTE